jgi:hypothetical protein
MTPPDEGGRERRRAPPADIIGEADVVGMGHEPDLVAWLRRHAHHTGLDGRPCWLADDLDRLIVEYRAEQDALDARYDAHMRDRAP